MSGEPALALLARLAEAASWTGKVRDYEPDAWGYLRRKLEETEAPLRALKRQQFERARDRLLDDLREPFLKPGALLDHKEALERLLTAADFADLSFHLEPGREPASRREGAEQVLAHAAPRTLFELEALPPERRPKEWEKLVVEMQRRLGLDRLQAVLEKKRLDAFRLGMTARRVRRNLSEYLAVTRHEQGVRDELTPFVLYRLEALIAALRRFVAPRPSVEGGTM